MKRFNCPDCSDYIQSCENCIRYVNSNKYVSNTNVDTYQPSLQELLDKLESSDSNGTFTLRHFPMQPSDAYYNDACKHCGNNPINGGSGICNCILGQPKIT